MGNMFSGQKVDMNLLEMLLYGIVPMGQLLMRADKLDGSLDHPWLLFPLFLIPPFSFIPVFLTQMGFLKKGKGGKPYNLFMLIPVIFRLILIIVLTQLGKPGGILLQTGLVIASLFVTNILSTMNQERCKNVESDILGTINKSGSDSMVQYASGVLLSFAVSYIPYLGGFLKGLDIIDVPYLADIVKSIIWSLGMIGGFVFVNMLDSNYATDTTVCKGRIPMIRTIISIVVFAVAMFYQLKPAFI